MVKFSVYLNRRVFVMIRIINSFTANIRYFCLFNLALFQIRHIENDKEDHGKKTPLDLHVYGSKF